MEDLFKVAIKSHLDKLAEESPLFGQTYANPDKNIDDCITYILNQVQKSGLKGFPAEQIYALAIHYYDEADIEIGKPINATVIVNHAVELTEEEKESAKNEAKERLIQQQMDIITGKGKKAKKQDNSDVQPTLF